MSGNVLTVSRRQTDLIIQSQQILDGADEVLDVDFENLAFVLKEGSQRRTVRALAYARKVVNEGVAAQVLVDISRPAPRQEVGGHLALLLASFPNAGKANLEVYGRQLVEDVAAMRPCRICLLRACRSVRLDLVFLPAIAEVAEAVASEQRQLSRWAESAAPVLRVLPPLIEGAEQRLQHERPKHVEDCLRRLLKHGEHHARQLSEEYSDDTVAEALTLLPDRRRQIEAQRAEVERWGQEIEERSAANSAAQGGNQ